MTNLADNLVRTLRGIGLVLPLAAAIHGHGAHAADPAPSWVGTWGVATQRLDNPGFNNQTIRQILHTSIGGTAARVHLSNLYSTQPLVIGAAHIALRANGSTIASGTDRALTFNGVNTVTVPPGQEVISDAVSMTIPALADVAISVYLPGASVPDTAGHSFALQDYYVSTGNVSGSLSMPNVKTNPVAGQTYFFVSGLDVQNASATGAIATFGASITDGLASAANTNTRWPNDLAVRLAQAGKTIGVVNTGITGNQLLADGSGNAGVSRFQRDVVQRPGVKWVIISDDPINDLTSHTPPPSTAQLTGGLQQIVREAHDGGLKVLCSTLTPYEKYSAWTAAQETIRQQVNSFIRGATSGCDAIVDQDAAVHDPANPTRLRADFDSGDHLHPNTAGLQAIANAIDLTQFNGNTLPPVKAPTQCGQFAPGMGLTRGQTLVSCDGRFTLNMQMDGNLVLYDGPSTPIWSTGTVTANAVQVLLQSDGNLVAFDPSGRTVWQSNTSGQPGSYLYVQNDGNMVIYNVAGTPVWYTGTCCR
ncbi:GDSL-type esterase/lipase family protein [Cupriavidus pampae]|uniref:Bulb-type lectin domain-containing protein n=1 Tax=Cupriavidus pampae TaxID=659251 RepID=A0ABN7ZII1_9BURK|nr:SGNH/GDSL hydrolase family protein [Cupriavidus pampae]CAG9184815.1 hypothetical protein LMG32289_05746 [Cupriavidus pampae]